MDKLLSLKFKENTFFYFIHIMDIPTNKGANSYKLKIWKRRNCTLPFCCWCLWKGNKSCILFNI